MYKVYQIEYEDTIEDILNKSGATMDELRELNGDFEVVPGNYIVIPNRQEKVFELYTVKSGDNMYALAKKYNIDVADLLSLNGLEKNDYIYPNQQLLVPTGTSNIYITKNGDTLEKVIKNFGVTIEEIINENERIYLLPDQIIVSKKKEKK